MAMNRELNLLEKIILANAMRGIDWLIVSLSGIILAIITLTVFSMKIDHSASLLPIVLILLAFAHLRYWGFRQNVSEVTVNFKINFIIYVVIIAVAVALTYFSRDFILIALGMGWGSLIYFNLAALIGENKRGKRDLGYSILSTTAVSGLLSVIWSIGLFFLDYIHKLS